MNMTFGLVAAVVLAAGPSADATPAGYRVVSHSRSPYSEPVLQIAAPQHLRLVVQSDTFRYVTTPNTILRLPQAGIYDVLLSSTQLLPTPGDSLSYTVKVNTAEWHQVAFAQQAPAADPAAAPAAAHAGQPVEAPEKKCCEKIGQLENVIEELRKDVARLQAAQQFASASLKWKEKSYTAFLYRRQDNRFDKICFVDPMPALELEGDSFPTAAQKVKLSAVVTLVTKADATDAAEKTTTKLQSIAIDAELANKVIAVVGKDGCSNDLVQAINKVIQDCTQVGAKHFSELTLGEIQVTAAGTAIKVADIKIDLTEK